MICPMTDKECVNHPGFPVKQCEQPLDPNSPVGRTWCAVWVRHQQEAGKAKLAGEGK